MGMNAVNSEIALRAGFVVAVFAAMALWEWRAPRRRLALGRGWRWANNLALIATGTILVRVLAPVSLVAIAGAAEGRGLVAAAGLDGLAGAAAGFVALDFVIYVQHVVFHRVPWLWRLHRLHHADLDLDVTTGLRFHPIEILISFAVKAAAIAALGVPAAAVLAFEIALNALALFNHANIGLPAAIEPAVRLAVVTPQMHEIHHLVEERDTNSNFGFNLSLWDRLFRTYAAVPSRGGEPVIGLPQFRSPAETRLDRLLTQPFRDDPASA
jgi:sterol desaturase/sphingolipid hydroxylase (fatty acid hydroxylase superfamily)